MNPDPNDWGSAEDEGAPAIKRSGPAYESDQHLKHETDAIPVSTLTDPDMQAVTAALMRAARRAHLIAHQTGTGVVVMRNGKVVEVEPDPKMYGKLLENIS